MPSEPYYYDLVAHYEQCLAQHGPTSKGVDWPNDRDLATRFQIMLELCNPFLQKDITPLSLLDLGCGYGAFLDFLKTHHLTKQIHYQGIDLSAKMIEAAIFRHDKQFFQHRDILIDKLPTNAFDFVVMNGIFTVKRNLTKIDMEHFFTEMIKCVFDVCRYGIAFNVMNFHVDWQRDDLFHLPFDQMATILQQVSRHLTIRADYGLYEYTVYVYKQPTYFR